MKFNIRLLYLYLFSFVGLLITIIGSTNLVSLGLKVYVFSNADIQDTKYVAPRVPEGVEEVSKEPRISDEERQETIYKEAIKRRQREMSNSLSMIIVGIPLYLYHWRTIKKEKK